MEKHTDRELLAKGVQRMAIALLLLFIGPIIIHSAFNNKEHALYYVVLGTGLLLASFAIYMGFKGIRTVMNAIFGKKS